MTSIAYFHTVDLLLRTHTAVALQNALTVSFILLDCTRLSLASIASLVLDMPTSCTFFVLLLILP